MRDIYVCVIFLRVKIYWMFFYWSNFFDVHFSYCEVFMCQVLGGLGARKKHSLFLTSPRHVYCFKSSRHHGGPVEDYTETPRTSLQYDAEGFKGSPKMIWLIFVILMRSIPRPIKSLAKGEKKPTGKKKCGQECQI